MAERPEEELTIAMIAARADVTPSPIYMRWSSLSKLLNDVAGERFVPLSSSSYGQLAMRFLNLG